MREDEGDIVTEWSKDAMKKQKKKNHTSQPGSTDHV